MIVLTTVILKEIAQETIAIQRQNLCQIIEKSGTSKWKYFVKNSRILIPSNSNLF